MCFLNSLFPSSSMELKAFRCISSSLLHFFNYKHAFLNYRQPWDRGWQKQSLYDDSNHRITQLIYNTCISYLVVVGTLKGVQSSDPLDLAIIRHLLTHSLPLTSQRSSAVHYIHLWPHLLQQPPQCKLCLSVLTKSKMSY